jgi:hypothetical protein
MKQSPRKAHWYSLPRPGTSFGRLRLGPCDEPCTHEDCKRLLLVAAIRCGLCGVQLGFGKEICDETSGKPRHRACDAGREVLRGIAV